MDPLRSLLGDVTYTARNLVANFFRIIVRPSATQMLKAWQ